jgi:hypothetical protein
MKEKKKEVFWKAKWYFSIALNLCKDISMNMLNEM